MKQTILTRSIVAASLGLALAVAALVVLVVRGLELPTRMAATGDEALALVLDRVLQRGNQGTSPGLAIRPLITPVDDADATALAGPVCEGMANRLVRVPGLRVASCRSTGVALAADLDDRALSRLLAIDHVMKGEIRSLPAGRLHLRLELRDARDGTRRWAMDEDIALADLQMLPVRVSSATGAALGIADAPPPPPPIDPQAHAKFMRARELARRPSIDDRRTAVRLLDEVLAVEPDHLESRFLQHNVKGWLLGNDGSGTSVESLNAARAANVAEGLALARRLVEADPQTCAASGCCSPTSSSCATGGRFRRLGAWCRQPSAAGVLRLSARVHLHAGYLDRARELAIAAARLNALDADAYEILALVAGMQRRDAEMREFIAIARQVVTRDSVPSSWLRRGAGAIGSRSSARIPRGSAGAASGRQTGCRPGARPRRSRRARGRRATARCPRRRDAPALRQLLLGVRAAGDTARSLASVRHHARCRRH